jgi:hypothetical protein
VLTVDERAGKRARHNLDALAGALQTSCRGTQISLCVRVGDETDTLVAAPWSDSVVARVG